MGNQLYDLSGVREELTGVVEASNEEVAVNVMQGAIRELGKSPEEFDYNWEEQDDGYLVTAIRKHEIELSWGADS